MSFNIAIDGPAGAGKSTIAKRVAKQLGFIYVDTGAMYRAIALYLLKHGVAADDEEGIRNACSQIRIAIGYENGEQQVLLNGENVTGQLRSEEVGNMASASSGNPDVREALLQLQREIAVSSNVVMDGRDIGTHVLPQAQLKIYLTASAGTRAQRRFCELQQKGIPGSLADIERDIATRDHQDMTRKIAPLKRAQDAVLVDSSEMTIDEVAECILSHYREVKLE